MIFIWPKITEENLEQACAAHRAMDDLFLHMKRSIQERMKYTKLTSKDLTTYKQLKQENENLIDLITEFALKNGYKLVPITD